MKPISIGTNGAVVDINLATRQIQLLIKVPPEVIQNPVPHVILPKIKAMLRYCEKEGFIPRAQTWHCLQHLVPLNFNI